MIRTTLNNTAPFFLAAAMPSEGSGDLYGIPASTLGFVLLIIMALAFIANQLWNLFDRARMSIRNPEANTSHITDACGRYRREIGRTLDLLREEDARQDALNKDRFDTIDRSIKAMRAEVREDNKEVTHRLDTMTSAVGELIGRTSK